MPEIELFVEIAGFATSHFASVISQHTNELNIGLKAGNQIVKEMFRGTTPFKKLQLWELKL
jgi:hypothetical protein